jgi:hypothetical protein
MQLCLGQSERALCGNEGILRREKEKTGNTALLGDQQEGMDDWHRMW